MAFAQYNKDIIGEIPGKLVMLRSSTRAIRVSCAECNQFIFMLYDNSNSVWINEYIFKFDHEDIETYDIYTTLA
jgi:hypothetical protein